MDPHKIQQILKVSENSATTSMTEETITGSYFLTQHPEGTSVNADILKETRKF